MGKSVAVVPAVAFALLLAWANMADAQAPASRDADPSNSARKVDEGGAARPSGLRVSAVSNKRVQGSDFHLGVFLQAIWFDVVWDTSKLKKPTEVVKGLVVIGDAAGEPKLRFVRVIRAPLTPGQEYRDEGIGFEYDESVSSHRWVRTTELKDMTFWFEPTEIIYQDGSMERF